MRAVAGRARQGGFKKSIGVGTRVLTLPLPSNHTGGSPASGSPVSLRLIEASPPLSSILRRCSVSLRIHFPTSLRSTVVTRFIATTDALTPAGRLFGPLGHEHRLTPAGLPDYDQGDCRPFRLQPSACRPGSARLSGVSALGLSPALQASSLASRLAHRRRPNRVHGDSPHGKPVLRTGRSRSVALHPALLRRSYSSIPHDSSPHRGGLSPPYDSLRVIVRTNDGWGPRLGDDRRTTRTTAFPKHRTRRRR